MIREAMGSRIVGEHRVRWLDSGHSRWPTIPSKRLFSNRKQRALPDDQQLTASQDDGVIPQHEFTRRAGRQVVQVVLNPEILKHVEPDDFVISMRSFQGGLERSWARGCISSAYVALRPDERVHVPFFAYLFKSSAYIQALQATSNLVRDGQALRFENFCMVHLPLVPIAEQRAIADFLDRETAALDHLLGEKERLLSVLTARRGAYLHYYLEQQVCRDNRSIESVFDGLSFAGRKDPVWISNWLNRTSNQRQNLHDLLSHQVRQINKFREAMISSAVTGERHVSEVP